MKPGASLQNLIENIDLLTKDFPFRDHKMVTGGCKDFYIKFKLLLNKLKSCMHTNIIIFSVPFSKMYTFLNAAIFIYNNKLCELIHKLGRCTKRKLIFIDYNSKKRVNYRLKNICEQVMLGITNKSHQFHSLIFIHTGTESIRDKIKSTINL